MITAFATLALVAPIAFGGELSVQLPPEARVQGMELTLGQVATVSGSDSELVARAGALSLGYSPAPGFQRVLELERLRALLLRDLGDVTVNVTVEGAERCRVRTATTTVTVERLRQEARAALRASLGEADVDVLPIGSLVALEVPEPREELTLQAVGSGRELGAGTWTIPVRVYVDGELYRTVSTSWEVALWERRSVLRRAVSAGDSLRPEDFETRRVRVGAGPEARALPPEVLEQAVAARNLEEGAVLSEHDVERRLVLHRGDVVSLEVQRGKVVVRALVTSLGEGRIGDRVRVRCDRTGKELVARVRSGELVAMTLE